MRAGFAGLEANALVCLCQKAGGVMLAQAVAASERDARYGPEIAGAVQLSGNLGSGKDARPEFGRDLRHLHLKGASRAIGSLNSGR